MAEPDQTMSQWTVPEVLEWAERIHLCPETVEIITKNQITGKDAVALDRSAMTALGIPPLDQSRILGNIQLMTQSTDDQDTEDAGGEATVEGSSEQSTTEAGDNGDDCSNSASQSASARRSTISYSIKTMPESLRMLKSRVWELFQHDVVASRTTRLFVEGDLVKYQEGKFQTETRRYLLLDSCLLWCSVKSKGKSMEMDSLSLKGRLDRGTYSVIDLPDKHKKGWKILNNAFKIFNKDKEKWYTLVAPNADGKAQWIRGFVDAGVIVEKSTTFDPSKFKLDGVDLKKMSNEAALTIMLKVRDGAITVDEALDIAQKEAASKTSSGTPSVDGDGDGDGDGDHNDDGNDGNEESTGLYMTSAANPESTESEPTTPGYVAATAPEVVATESETTGHADASVGANAEANASTSAGESDTVDTGSGASAASGVILVLGATGNIGGRVANQLLDAGASVRVAARNVAALDAFAARGAETVEFDWDKPEVWPDAFAGCSAVFIVAPFVKGFCKDVAAAVMAASVAGVKHITKLSAFGVPAPGEAAPSARGAIEHQVADSAVVKSGMGWTLIKPTFFCSNVLNFQSDTIKGGGGGDGSDSGGQFFGASEGGKVCYISPDDVAAVAAVSLLDPTTHAGKSYSITGPEALTDVEVAEILSKHLGHPVTYVNVPADEFEKSLKEGGVPEWNAKEVVALEKVKAAGYAATPTDTVQTVLGRPATSFAEFLAASATN